MPQVHERALVEPGAQLDEAVVVWAFSQVREGARIGAGSSIGSHSYIDADVSVGINCKIQSGALLFKGAEIGDGVFVGPGAVITNDRSPRAVNPDGTLKNGDDWEILQTRVGSGASLGAGCVVVAGAVIGSFALVGAGAVVTRNVPAHAIVIGSPARIHGWICCCGSELEVMDQEGTCHKCKRKHKLSSQ